MNKEEFCTVVAANTSLTKKDVKAVLNAAFDVIQETVADGEKVTIVDFGVFECRNRKERDGRNPKTNEKISIPAMVVPAFSPGKGFKEKVAKKAS